MDGDDAWLPGKLKMQVELLENNDKAGLVYADTYIADNRTFMASDSSFRRVFQMRQPRRGPVFERLFIENFIPTSSVMVRKACLSKVGRFDPCVVPIEDYDMWLRIAAKYEVDYIDVPLAKYRDHVAGFRSNKIVTITHIIDVLNNALSGYPILRSSLGKKVDERVAHFHVMLGKAYLSKLLFKKAFYNFDNAFKLTRSPAMPFYVLFSFIAESIMDILRYFKSKVRA